MRESHTRLCTFMQGHGDLADVLQDVGIEGRLCVIVCLAGRGELDAHRLAAHGDRYDGYISIEHEDPSAWQRREGGSCLNLVASFDGDLADE